MENKEIFTQNDFLCDPQTRDTAQEYYILMEVPTEAVLRRLPKWIKPVELRPGIGLIGVGASHFSMGDTNKNMSAHEISAGIIVQPMLKKNMPVPQASVFTFNVTSDRLEILQYANEIQKFSCFVSEDLKVSADDNFDTCSCSDIHGPLFGFRPSNLNLVFNHAALYIQVFSETGGRVYMRFTHWKGERHEAQEPKKSSHTLFPHPFYEEVITDPTTKCHMEILGRSATVSYYQPVLLK